MKGGSLRSNLIVKKYNPNDKYENLYWVTESLSTLHKCNLVICIVIIYYYLMKDTCILVI